jgi:hypothetical protein
LGGKNKFIKLIDMRVVEMLKPFMNVNDLNHLDTLVENEKYLEATQFLRLITDIPLIRAGKLIKQMAKEDYKRDVMKFVERY